MSSYSYLPITPPSGGSNEPLAMQKICIRSSTPSLADGKKALIRVKSSNSRSRSRSRIIPVRPITASTSRMYYRDDEQSFYSGSDEDDTHAPELAPSRFGSIFRKNNNLVSIRVKRPKSQCQESLSGAIPSIKIVRQERPASGFSDLHPTIDVNRPEVMDRNEHSQHSSRRSLTDLSKEDPGQSGQFDVPHLVSYSFGGTEVSSDYSEKSSVTSPAAMIKTLPKIVVDMENCAWRDMHNRLQVLSASPDLVLEELCSTDSNGSNAMHFAAWKCPPQLATLLYNLLTEQEYSYFSNVNKDGNTPIHLCCANLCIHSGQGTTEGHPYVDLSALEFLLERAPESLGVQNFEGDTPLHLFLASPLASHSNKEYEGTDGYSLSVLNLFEDHMASKSYFLQRDVTGCTPLHTAIANGASEAIILRLIDIAPEACKMEDDVGLTPLHYIAAFRSTPLSIAVRLTQEYQYAICHKTRNGDTPLHTMISNSTNVDENSTHIQADAEPSFTDDDISLMRILLGDSEHKDLNEEYCPPLIQNKEKLTPLHCFALFNAPLEIGNILVAHPSSSKTRLMKNSFGSTPLHLAAAHPKVSLQTIQLLSTLTHASALDAMHRTPLHIAAQNTHISEKVMRSLIQSNPLACNKESDGGYLPLHMAVHCLGRVEVIHELVDSYPAALERESILGDTPLHKAASNNASADVIKLVLHKFPNAIYAQNNMGDLPLHCCASTKNSNIDVIRILLEAWPQGASLQNRSGNCPLHYLVKHRNEKEMDAIDLLANEGSMSVNLLNDDGKSPIDIAKETGASSEVIYVLETAAEQWRKNTLEEDWGKFDNFDV